MTQPHQKTGGGAAVFPLEEKEIALALRCAALLLLLLAKSVPSSSHLRPYGDFVASDRVLDSKAGRIRLKRLWADNVVVLKRTVLNSQ